MKFLISVLVFVACITLIQGCGKSDIQKQTELVKTQSIEAQQNENEEKIRQQADETRRVEEERKAKERNSAEEAGSRGSDWKILSCRPDSTPGFPPVEVSFRVNPPEAMIGGRVREASVTSTTIEIVIGSLGVMQIDRISGRYTDPAYSGKCTALSQRQF